MFHSKGLKCGPGECAQGERQTDVVSQGYFLNFTNRKDPYAVSVANILWNGRGRIVLTATPARDLSEKKAVSAIVRIGGRGGGWPQRLQGLWPLFCLLESGRLELLNLNFAEKGSCSQVLA